MLPLYFKASRTGKPLEWSIINKSLDCIAWNMGAAKQRRARGRRALSPRAPVFLAPFHFWVHGLSYACYGSYQDVIILFFFQAFAMAQFVLLLFGSVLLALSLSQEMSPRCLQLAVQKTNGCSVPAGLWAPYKNTFTPACYKHDFCYFCVRITFFINTN